MVDQSKTHDKLFPWLAEALAGAERGDWVVPLSSSGTSLALPTLDPEEIRGWTTGKGVAGSPSSIAGVRCEVPRRAGRLAVVHAAQAPAPEKPAPKSAAPVEETRAAWDKPEPVPMGTEMHPLADALQAARNGWEVVPINPVSGSPIEPYTDADATFMLAEVHDRFLRCALAGTRHAVGVRGESGRIIQITRHNRLFYINPKPGEEEEEQESPLREALADGARTPGALLADPTPPPEPVLGGGLLRGRMLAQLHGPDGSRKSWALLHLAVCAASGRPWFGLLTREAGIRVGLVSLEDDLWLLQGRLRAVLAGENVDAETVDRNLVLVAPPYFDGNLDVTQPEQAAALGAWVAANHLELLLIDHLSRIHALPDERDLRPVAGPLIEIARSCGAAVLVAHHDRKSPAGARGEDSFSSRGDSRFQADCRLVLAMSEKSGRVRLSVQKSTGAQKPAPVWLEHGETGALRVVDAPTKAKERAGSNMATMSGLLEAADDRGLTATEIAGRMPDQPSVRTIRRYAGEMADRIEVLGRGPSTRYRAKRKPLLDT